MQPSSHDVDISRLHTIERALASRRLEVSSFLVVVCRFSVQQCERSVQDTAIAEIKIKDTYYRIDLH
jgi:hypothetical protein